MQKKGVTVLADIAGRSVRWSITWTVEEGNLGQGWINSEKEARKTALYAHTNRANDENPRPAPWASFLVGSGLIGSHRG